MFNCNCCFEEIDEFERVFCKGKKHISCVTCVNSALKVANSEHRILCCFECPEHFDNLGAFCERTQVDELNELLTVLSLKEERIFFLPKVSEFILCQ